MLPDVPTGVLASQEVISAVDVDVGVVNAVAVATKDMQE